MFCPDQVPSEKTWRSEAGLVVRPRAQLLQQQHAEQEQSTLCPAAPELFHHFREEAASQA